MIDYKCNYLFGINEGSSGSASISLRYSLIEQYREFATRIRRLFSSNSHQEMKNEEDIFTTKNYGNIAPTAALVTYYRSFSNIPFAKEIAEESNAKEICKGMVFDDELLLSRVRIAFEARFKSIDAIIKKYSNIKQFIEIPAGLSTRGISMTESDSSITYIESDLPEILKTKQELVKNLIAPADNERTNLHFKAANLLDKEQLNNAVKIFNDGPIVIITEGLLSYLTLREKTMAAQNIHALLKAHGGVWIVTDLTRVFDSKDQGAAELRNRISTTTGFSPVVGCFTDVSEAKYFFKHLGFKVHDYRRSEVIGMLSTKPSSGLSDKEIRKLLQTQATFALEI